MRIQARKGIAGSCLLLLGLGSMHSAPPGDKAATLRESPVAEDRIHLARIELQDQFQETCSYVFPMTRPMVLLVADRKGYEMLSPWIQVVRDETHGEATILGIADLRAVPGFLRGKVRRAFRSGQDYSVLLDWDGEVLTMLQPGKGVPNVYLVNRQGHVLLHLQGEVTAGNIARLCARLSEASLAKGASFDSTEDCSGQTP